MPNKSSGTERPYAPLLEPYIKLNLVYRAGKMLNFAYRLDLNLFLSNF